MKIHTPRLRLEPLEERHAEVLFDGLQSPHLYEFTPDEPPRSVEALCARYRRLACRRSPDGTELWLNWAVWSLAEERYVGYVQSTITEDRKANVAYVFFPDAWGKGYGREAVKRMLDHLVENYDHPEFRAYSDVRNHRSISLLQDLGFVRVGVRKAAEPIKGESTDEAEYRKP